VERGRYFGLEVVVPFRLCDAAGADQILASGTEEPQASAREGSAQVDRSAQSVARRTVYGATRSLTLDGIPRLVPATEIRWRAARGCSAASASSVAAVQFAAVATH
jgi:hypothetical protein